MPVHVGRAHGDAIVGGAGAPVDLVNKVAETGGPASGYVHGSENATVQSGTGKKRTRTVRHKKRRTKNKTASRSHTGRRHKKNTMKKHSSKKHNKKARSHRRKRSVKVHKQTGKGGYALVGHEIGVGPKATYAEAKPLADCGRL
jgi:hypothetical protein